MATSLLDQTTAARVSVIVRSAHDVSVNVSFEAEPRWESKMRRQWQHAQSRIASTAPRTHEVVVSPTEGGRESPTVATETANGVNRECDDREERGFAESCSLVMESLDKRLSQIAHRMVVVENQIMDWSHQVLIQRHDDTGLMDRSASTPGSSGNYVGTWEAFDVNLPKMRGDELHEDKLVAKTRGDGLHEDNLVAKMRGDEAGHAPKARPEPEGPKLEVGGEAEVDQSAGLACGIAGQTDRHHLLHGRCPCHRKHTRRRDQDAANQSAADHDDMGSVINCINNSGRFGQSAVLEFDGPKLGMEVEAQVHDVRPDETEANQSAGLSGTIEIERWRYRGAAAGATVGKPQEHQAVQSAVPDFDGLKLGNGVKAEIHDVRHDKTKSDQLVGLPGTMEIERLRYRNIAAGAAAGRPQEFLKHGNEVEAEAHDVRLDNTKVDQAAGMLGAMEVERLRYAAGQAAGRQARPISPIPTAADLDADLAVNMAEQAENTTHFMNAARDKGVPESSMCVGAGTMEIERPRYGGITSGAMDEYVAPVAEVAPADMAETALYGVKAEVVDCIQTVSTAGQTRHRSPMPTADHAHEAVPTADQFDQSCGSLAVLPSNCTTDTQSPKRWADLSDDATDVDSESTEHLLLERMRETMPQVPRGLLEELRAEPGQQRWTAVVAGWRSWMAERHRNFVEKEAECNDVSATGRSRPFQQARKKAKPRSGRRKPENRDEVSKVNEGTRRKKRADLSDCTTDAGSHSDLDKDAAGQELLEKMLVAWPRMPRSLLERIRAEPGQQRWTALVAVWDQANGGTELSSVH